MNSMKVKQLSIFLQNKKGSLYDALETLSENEIILKKEKKYLKKTIWSKQLT